jgi:hypothetical protein
MSPNKFGEQPNSIASTLNLPGSDPLRAIVYEKNYKSFYVYMQEMERWAARGFVSGYSVTDVEEATSGA